MGEKKRTNETLGTELTFSETQGPLELSETHGPMAPQTFSSLDVCNAQEHMGELQLEPIFGLAMYKIDIVLYLDFQGASKSHAEVSIIVFVKYSLEGLLEQGSIEGVAHHNVAPVNTNCNYYLVLISF